MVVLQNGLNPNLGYVPHGRMLSRTDLNSHAHRRSGCFLTFTQLTFSTCIVGSWNVLDRSEEVGTSDQRQKPRRLRSMMMVLDWARCLETDALLSSLLLPYLMLLSNPNC